MIRILHVITSLEIGGAEKLMVDLIPRLKSPEIKVDLLVFNPTRTIFTEQLEEQGIKVMTLSNSANVYNPLNIFRLIPIIKKYDIIHAHNTACQLFVPIAKTISFAKCKIITTEHSTQNRRRGNKLLRLVDKWMYSKYKFVICVSEKVNHSLLYHLHIKKPTDKFLTINNGVDTNKFANAKSSNTIPSFSDTDRIVLMVARFAYPKDQNTVIKSLQFLPHNVKLLFVGDGNSISESKKLVDELYFNSRVFFLGVRTDIPELMKVSDIIVLASHFEGLSLSSIEAMASGRPFVASDVPGLREVVSGACLLFPDGDSKKLAEIINKLLSDEDYYSSVASSCTKRAKDYDISKTADAYKNIYLSLK